MRGLRSVVVAGFLVACGPSPDARDVADAPSGTLVVVIRQGPERVPFKPKVARIQRANAQLAKILGHSIQIELDGALLPQTHDGAEDVIARLVEDVARDLDALGAEDARALGFARAHFERLSVRYSPADAAAREQGARFGRRATGAKHDVSAKTIDVARSQAGWAALDRGEISDSIYRAYAASAEARYGGVLPDALPRGERSAWFEHHTHGRRTRAKAPHASIGSVDARTVRGMIMIHRLADRDGDAALAKDARAWLVSASSDFSSTYHHHAAEVEAAPPSSEFHAAESAWVGWVRAELPKMTLDERAKIAAHLWVVDFRRPSDERDRYATYAFPGLDPMAISFQAVDAWIAAGHPSPPRAREVHPYFETIVCPAFVEPDRAQLGFSTAGRCDGVFYRWALADRAREDRLVAGTIARRDPPFAMAVFYNARRVLREETDYLRFLRRFEAEPSLWTIGADVHREGVYRPSSALLEESRRLWRDAPGARGHVLMWFARHAEGSYHPETEWPDLVKDAPADVRALAAFLDLGGEAFELLPAAWPGIAKSRERITMITARSRTLLGAGASLPRGHSVAGTLTALARVLCKENSLGELAELRAFASAELPARPGSGLSDVVEASDPAGCAPKARAATPRKASAKHGRPF